MRSTWRPTRLVRGWVAACNAPLNLLVIFDLEAVDMPLDFSPLQSTLFATEADAQAFCDALNAVNWRRVRPTSP